MPTCYPTTAPGVNASLPTHLLNLLDLLHDLSARRGFCWARNQWLAERLNRSERQISRQISDLDSAGEITAQRIGNERHIFIAKNAAPETVKSTLRKPAHVYPMSTRCLPNTLEDENRADNNSSATPASPEGIAAPLVAELRAHGIAAPVAEQLAAADPEQCRAQLAALPARHGIRDAAATLVSAIKGKWSTRKRHQEQVRKRKSERSASSRPTPDTDQAGINYAPTTYAAAQEQVIAALAPPLRRRAEQGKDRAILHSMTLEQIKRDPLGNLSNGEPPNALFDAPS